MIGTNALRLNLTRVRCKRLAACLGAVAAAFAMTTAYAAAAQTDLLRNDADGANWAGYGRTYDENHYSPLHEISASNVAGLKLAWYHDLPTLISTFGAPLAVDGTLYFGVGLSLTYAMDAASGKILWTYDPDVAAVSGESMRGAHGVRGIAYWQGRVITGTEDGRLISIDAKTGSLGWSVQTTEGPADGRFITSAPRIFNGKVIIGHSGGDLAAVRGYVTAYDAASGRKLWRFYTVPGNPAKGFEDKAMETAAKTWTGDWWQFGGGATVWNAITYDPDLDRIYIGTGNGAPWNQKIRSPGGGDNLFVCSIVALDAKTGRYVWHYQTNPGDNWDFDAATDMELSTLTINGKLHRVLLDAPKNGFFYVIDRDTGKLLSAEPFTKVTWATHVDLQTGRPVETSDARFPSGHGVVQPGGTGAHNWEPMAYSPETRLVYIPTTILPFQYDADGIDVKTWRASPHMQNNTGYNTLQVKDAPPVIHASLGALQAYDPVAQKSVWTVPLLSPYNGGVAASAGNLVFQGNAEGRFVAYDARSGAVLWTFDAQDGIIGQPIIYQVHGRQYVTVITGFSGVPAALGPQVAQFNWNYRTQRRRVLTFALDGAAALPPKDPEPVQPFADDARFVLDAALVDKGVAVYADHCFSCHGVAATAAGTAPDLRKSLIPLDGTAFDHIVRGGALQPHGMPRFQELTDEEMLALRNYIRYEARREAAAQVSAQTISQRP